MVTILVVSQHVATSPQVLASVPLKVVSRINLTGSLLPLAAVISKEINLDVVDAAEALALAMLPELLVTEVPAESLAAATLEEEDVAILLIN